jgi:hypothetical protein
MGKEYRKMKVWTQWNERAKGEIKVQENCTNVKERLKRRGWRLTL